MLKILYVEDDPVNMQIVQRSLNRIDAELFSAFDAPEGMRKAEEILPDVILMDVDLPGPLDGIDAVEMLKSDPKLAPIPVIILTADQTPSTWQRGKAVGCDIYLLKPIRRTLLLRTIMQVVNHDPVM